VIIKMKLSWLLFVPLITVSGSTGANAYVNLLSLKIAILILGKNGPIFAQTAAPSHAVCLITVFADSY